MICKAIIKEVYKCPCGYEGDILLEINGEKNEFYYQANEDFADSFLEIGKEIKADILIVDEVLSVGDFRFQKKCMNRIEQMLAEGTTLLFVSHSTDLVRTVCQKAIWLKKGRVQMFGDVNAVCDAYESDE